MMILIVLTALSLAAIVASLVSLRRDGYRHVPVNRESQTLLIERSETQRTGSADDAPVHLEHRVGAR